MTAKADPAHPLHVLLVEDENVIRMIIAEALLDAGFRVTQADNGERAIGLFGESRGFDLLLTDVHMPGRVNGVERARTRRARWPDGPVGFATGRPDALPPVSAMGPRDRLVLKPCRSSALLDAVEASLAA